MISGWSQEGANLDSQFWMKVGPGYRIAWR
jgi:hypothetical protein